MVVCFLTLGHRSNKPQQRTKDHLVSWSIYRRQRPQYESVASKVIKGEPFAFTLVVLLAITSGQRCQTLTNLDISSIKKTEKYYLRVSMGLTVRRKTAKNLAVRRKNERILAVSRKKI